ncbi:hypothetical protein N7495_005671 [Penicillium taxi]|uniref:uncharacterized protein n=1 Tax=Penicillium taxi TaxID=168475 RepID=UPI00254520F3|nr:uncharacterized protein N7495_005671 [Penicillium taxi]KAJ5893980.1 hypothetical protein N7495_005671 [Penicillium taxi]
MSKKRVSFAMSTKTESATGSTSGISCASSGGFPASVQSTARRLCHDVCWVCGSLDPEIAHAFGKADKGISKWRERELMNFAPRGLDNSIPLCPNCHSQYDRVSDPGLTIIPVDIPYFLNFEKEDQVRRLNGGWKEQREVPTIEQYEDGEEDEPGLYRRVWLKEYMVPRIIQSGQGAWAFLTTPKAWYGSSVALFRQAFAATRSTDIYAALDEKTVDELGELHKLYFKEPASSVTKEQEGQGSATEGKGEAKRPVDKEEENEGGQQLARKPKTAEDSCYGQRNMGLAPMISLHERVEQWVVNVPIAC